MPPPAHPPSAAQQDLSRGRCRCTLPGDPERSRRAQAHPSSLSQTVETVIPTNQAHRPTTEQTLEIILETLDSVHDDVKSMRGEFDSLKADVKALDRKYTLAPLASALTASLMSLVLNQFKSKSSSN
jgi:hypothetical protein